MSITIEQMPISKLASLKANLNGMLDAGKDLLHSLEKAKPKPHVLDDATIEHIKRVYTDQAEEINIYQSLLIQWQDDGSSQQQKERLKAFDKAIHAVKDIHKQVFFLIDFFKEHTIEKVLMKDSGQLVEDILARKVFPPNGLNEESRQPTIVPSKLMPCEKCGKLFAHLVFAEESTIEDVERHGVMMHEAIKKKNIDTWIIGEPLEIRDDNALCYVMKVWPKKGKPTKMLSSDFNDLLNAIESKHC